MKKSNYLFLILFTTCLCYSKPIDVFFGTAGRDSEGIYHATFNPANGKFSPSKLAAKIGSPGFLATHPNGKILYSVGRWDEGSGALGYHIGEKGKLTEFTRMICPDGGSAHIAVHPSGKFLLTAQYGGGSVALFHSMQMANLVNPPSRNTKVDPRWWTEDRILPTPIGQDSLPTENMPSSQTLDSIRS